MLAIVRDVQASPIPWLPDSLVNASLAVVIVFFLCALVWRVFPHLIEWLKAQAASHRAMADAIPEMRDSMKTIAAGQGILANIDRKMDVLAKAVTEMLEDRLAAIQDGVRELLERMPKP
jgi:hypothetical protein